jgi:hypothetical protein
MRYFWNFFRGIRELDDWITGRAPKPNWLRRRKMPIKHFETLDDIVEDHLKSLPNDEARREFLARARAAAAEPIKSPRP